MQKTKEKRASVLFSFTQNHNIPKTWDFQSAVQREQLGADSALLSKTGLRIHFHRVCSWICTGSDTLQQGQTAEETSLPVCDVIASVWARGGKEEQAWEAGSPFVWQSWTQGMIQKIMKTKEVNSSPDSKDMQLNRKRGGMFHSSLRTIRAKDRVLQEVSPACMHAEPHQAQSELLLTPAVPKPTAANLHTFFKCNNLKCSEAKHRVI